MPGWKRFEADGSFGRIRRSYAQSYRGRRVASCRRPRLTMTREGVDVTRCYIASHGEWKIGSGMTFVPAGRRALFFADESYGVLTTVGLAAIAAGDIAPRQVYDAGERIRNYRLEPSSKTMQAVHLASVSSRLRGHVVGAPPLELGDDGYVWLCTTPRNSSEVVSAGKRPWECRPVHFTLPQYRFCLCVAVRDPRRLAKRDRTSLGRQA